MPVLSFPLTSLDAFRFISFRDTAQALEALGITTRQQIAQRLGVHIDYVPDMDEMVGPLHIELACAGVVDDVPDEPWVRSGPCRQDACRVSVMRCDHEHIVTAPLCATHVRLSLRQASMWCGLCRDRGADEPMREVHAGRAKLVDAFLMDVLMRGVTTADPEERAEIEAFVIDNLDQIVAPHLREPLEQG
ncbi:hypothetical protein [Nonomuraea sp. NPDC050643]|uniref:hypothetical protein n=1 Tax=Nonomuraea sp. NPDC050643 TaxID=3155660 RepID=UPI00340CDDBF